MPTKLILIRHGETEWNRLRKYMGRSDIGLNARGKSQAARARRSLKKEKIDTIYSSDKKRAMSTARIIFGDRPIEVKKGLREMELGGWEGLTYDMCMKKYGKVYQSWLNDPFHTKIPGGESMKDFAKRVMTSVKKIASKNENKTVAIVTHGGPIGIILKNIMKTDGLLENIPKPGSVTTIEIGAHG